MPYHPFTLSTMCIVVSVSLRLHNYYHFILLFINKMVQSECRITDSLFHLVSVSLRLYNYYHFILLFINKMVQSECRITDSLFHLVSVSLRLYNYYDKMKNYIHIQQM